MALSLLGRFAIDADGAPVRLAPAAQRVIALIALLGGAANRSRVAGTLWPEGTERRSLANLRGVLWRMPPPVRDHVESQGVSISLDDAWDVDLDASAAAARSLREASELTEPIDVDRQLFSRDLLPDWDATWLLVLRERHRQLRLHALEDLAAAELRAGRPLDAVDTCMTALASEPLRESTQLLSLRAHLDAGNRVTAVRQFEQFAELLRADLGVEPSDAMCSMVAFALDSNEAPATPSGGRNPTPVTPRADQR